MDRGGAAAGARCESSWSSTGLTTQAVTQVAIRGSSACHRFQKQTHLNIGGRDTVPIHRSGDDYSSPARIGEHFDGSSHSLHLIKAALAAGIGFDGARIRTGMTRNEERHMKLQGGCGPLLSTCKPAGHIGSWSIADSHS